MVFFSSREASHTVYCIRQEVIFHGKPFSCRRRGVQAMHLYDSIICPHVPRCDSRTRIFPLEGLSNFMTKNVFQWCTMISTYQECSGCLNGIAILLLSLILEFRYSAWALPLCVIDNQSQRPSRHIAHWLIYCKCLSIDSAVYRTSVSLITCKTRKRLETGTYGLASVVMQIE
jgi:hypothetical protein